MLIFERKNVLIQQPKKHNYISLSAIIPVPKKASVVTLNNLRPVALMSAVMEVFERVLFKNLKVVVEDFLDPFSVCL